MHIDNWVRIGIIATVLSTVFNGWTVYRGEFPKQQTAQVAASGKAPSPMTDPSTLRFWLILSPTVASSLFLALALLIASRKRNVPSPASLSRSLPNTPIVAATKITFASLSVSQQFLVREIYEHPGTAVAFLGTTLSNMKFAPRVVADSLNKVLTTNLCRRTPGIPGNVEPNPEVRDIVASLLEEANLPAPETVRQINEETTTALAMDHRLGHESALEQARTEATHERELLQSQLRVETNNSIEDREELQRAKELIRKLTEQISGRAVPGDAPRLLVSCPKNKNLLSVTNDGSNGAVNVEIGPLVHVEKHEVRPIYKPFGSIPAKATEERKITVAQHQPNITGDLWSTIREKRMDPDPLDFVDVFFDDLAGNKFQQRFILTSEVEESVTWKPQAVKFVVLPASAEAL
ncbi:MAG TPA: hypothetical protein VMH80_17345 [Bryobacteraceae bacterium]|nr:hypothetical protein [Bryobacteraceae bacterium]